MDKIKFYDTDLKVKQSAFYPVSKSEIIEYFRGGGANDFDAFEKIENHEKFRFHLPHDPGTFYRFHPVGEEDYYFQITTIRENIPPLHNKIKKMIDGKYPIEPKNKEAFIIGPEL